MTAYAQFLPGCQSELDELPFLLTESDIVSPEDEARHFLWDHPCEGGAPTPQQIRLGICSDYDVGIYDAQTAIKHLIDFGALYDPKEFMMIVSAGIRALSTQEGARS